MELGQFGRSIQPQNVQSLEELVDTLKGIERLLPISLILTDDEGIILHANEQAHNMFEYSTGELINIDVTSLIATQKEPILSNSQHTNQQNIQPASTSEIRETLLVKRRSGHELALEIALTPVKVDGNNLSLVALLNSNDKKALKDNLKETNQSLRISEQRMRMINEMLPVGLLVVDEYGYIQDFNNASQCIFGFSSSEFLSKNVDELLPDNLQNHHSKLRLNYLKNPKPRKMAAGREMLLGKRKDGTLVNLEIGLSPVQMDGLNKVLVTLIDVTERKALLEDLKNKNSTMNAAIERLTKSNEQLEQFAYICSHDLQEPIRMVRSFSQLVEQKLEGKLDEQTKKYLGFVSEGAHRAQLMISDVLAYSRLDATAGQKKWINLSEICQQVYDSIQYDIREKSGHFTWVENLPTLYAVPSQIFQLTLNLVSNGFKFNRSFPPKVHVSANLVAEGYKIQIQDNGIGINPRYQDKIFNIFERLNQRSEYPGTGIGLATCRKVAEQHQATILVESEEGSGSTFVILWPKETVDK